MKKITAYFKKYPSFNSLVHVIIGMGLGVLITYPLAGSHPLRWGVALVSLGVAFHLYPLWSGK